MIALLGELPPQVNPAAVTRLVWVSADTASAAQTVDCHLRPPRGWSCDTPSTDDTAAGVVVIETDDGVGFVVRNPTGVVASGIATWGRLLRVVPAGSEAEVTAAALKVSRPIARPNTRSLEVEADAGVHVWVISATAFWIAGKERSPDPDAFVRLTAAESASHDEPLDVVGGDAAVVPLDLALERPMALEGRVESPSGLAVAGALVDLFALRPEQRAQQTPDRLKAADVMRVAETRTDDSGTFAFRGLEAQTYKVAVVDFEHGRTEQWTTIDGVPLLVRLKAPSKATGRVLRQKLPASGVVVRFIPDAAVWRESSDPSTHLALDTTSDDVGRFTLRLPPVADGMVQLTAPDGASQRVRLSQGGKSSDIALGDIALADPIAVEFQTDVAGCAIAAAGPAGAGGFSVVRAKSDGVVHALLLSEPGQWLLQVECGGVQRRVAPPSLDVSAKGELSTRTLHVE